MQQYFYLKHVLFKAWPPNLSVYRPTNFCTQLKTCDLSTSSNNLNLLISSSCKRCSLQLVICRLVTTYWNNLQQVCRQQGLISCNRLVSQAIRTHPDMARDCCCNKMFANVLQMCNFRLRMGLYNLLTIVSVILGSTSKTVSNGLFTNCTRHQLYWEIDSLNNH